MRERNSNWIPQDKRNEKHIILSLNSVSLTNMHTLTETIRGKGSWQFMHKLERVAGRLRRWPRDAGSGFRSQ